MGSVPSSPNGISASSDPWWSIENQILNLDQSPLQINMNSDQSQGHQINIDENAHSSNSSTTNISVSISEENSKENVVKNTEKLNEIKENDVKTIEKSNQQQLYSTSMASNAASTSTTTKLEIKEPTNSHALAHSSSKEQSLDEFKADLLCKREQRQSALAELRTEIVHLKSKLSEQREINRKLRRQQCKQIFIDLDHSIESGSPSHSFSLDDDDCDDVVFARKIQQQENEKESNLDDNDTHSRDISLKSELAQCQLSLQLANGETLSLSSELKATQKQVLSLKEVIRVTKEMVAIRDEHLVELKGKLKEIEDSLAERELKIMSDNLRLEYDRQLTNIRNLRALYEERARVNAAERENLIRQLDTKRTELDAEIEKGQILQERVTTLEKEIETKNNTLIDTKDELMQYKAENKELQEEMTVINELFSQLLMGFNGGNDINIDKLTHMLEDHRDLLNDITNRESSKEGAAALPKLLFDLVNQSKEEQQDPIIGIESTSDDDALTAEVELALKPSVTSAQEIINNLPKVWKVLIELLNHQKAETANGQSEDCYNSVQTPTGPQLVLSVSKTYIKLKDLILEKKFLQKETHKLKNLNNHLESRLSQQENRLSAVSIELNKTWSLVGRMQRQHRQLHTHEQVLRYQLQQKRRMLNELKDELEYCRRKWALAREKNNESQSQWNTLRLEFSKRKEQDASNSGESGFSDDLLSDEENSDEESNRKQRLRTLKAELLAQPKNKSVRTQSVSPIRGNSTNNIITKRGHSAPNITALLPEIYQTTTEIVSPEIEAAAAQTATTSNLSYAALTSVVTPIATEHIFVEPMKTSEVATKVTKKQDITKMTGCRPRLSREVRRRSAIESSTKKSGESLEEMFFRISGEPMEECQTDNKTPQSISQNEHDDDARRAERSARFQRLEEQCQQLINQVIKTTAKVEEPTVSSDCPSTETIEQIEELQSTNITDNAHAIADRRSARLKILEDECKTFLNKVTVTNNTATELGKKMDTLYERYGINEKPTDEADKLDEAAGNDATNDEASCSNTIPIDAANKRTNTIADRRAARLQTLESDCKSYLEKVSERNVTAIALAKRTKDICERYGIETEQQNDSKLNDATQSISSSGLTSNEEAYLARRAERLKRLEEQSTALLNRMAESADRASSIDKQLDQLHEQYALNDSDSIDGKEEHSIQNEYESTNNTDNENKLSVVYNQDNVTRDNDVMLENSTEEASIETTNQSTVDETDAEIIEDQNNQTPREHNEILVLSPLEEALLDRRAARFSRLEDEHASVVRRMSRTPNRAATAAYRLDSIPDSHNSSVGLSTLIEEDQQIDEQEDDINLVDIISIENSLENSVEQRNENSVLTSTEEAYLARRAERLRRLEEESNALMVRMSQTAQRANNIEEHLDTLHSSYDSEENQTPTEDESQTERNQNNDINQ